MREGGKYALVEMRSKFGAREGYGLDLEGEEAMLSKAKMSEVLSCQDVEMLRFFAVASLRAHSIGRTA